MEFMQQLAAVAAVIGLLAACLWWLRRRGVSAVWRSRREARRCLQTVERLPLGPQHSVHLIRMGERALIVGCSPAGCALLAERAWHEITPASAVGSGETCGG